MRHQRNDFYISMLNMLLNIGMLTEEERLDANLVKNRKDFKENPISIYFGSKKEGLDDVCETCSRSDICEMHKDIVNTRHKILSSLKDESFISQMKDENNFTNKELEKVKNNVYMAINCIFKE